MTTGSNNEVELSYFQLIVTIKVISKLFALDQLQ